MSIYSAFFPVTVENHLYETNPSRHALDSTPSCLCRDITTAILPSIYCFIRIFLSTGSFPKTHKQSCNFSSRKMVSWPHLPCQLQLHFSSYLCSITARGVVYICCLWSFPPLPLKPNPIWLVPLLLHQICHWQDHPWLPCCQIWRAILSPRPGWTVSSIIHNLSSSLVPFLPSALRTTLAWFFSFSLFTPSQLSFLPPSPLTVSEGWRSQGSVLGPFFLSIFPWLYPVYWLQLPSIYQWFPNLYLQLGLLFHSRQVYPAAYLKFH